MAPQRGHEPFGPQKSFVIEMRARREAAGLSRHKLAETLGCTPQWLAKVENFEKAPSEGLSDDLDTYYATGGSFRRLWEQIVEARKQGLIPSGFRPLIEAEQEADEISFFEPTLIPGLFQAEEYARLVLSAGLRPEKTEELVAIRMERQALFTRADPPWLFLLIREAVIRDLPSEVRVGQCKRLLDLMDEPKVSIQIIPTSARVRTDRLPGAQLQQRCGRRLRRGGREERSDAHRHGRSSAPCRTLQRDQVCRRFSRGHCQPDSYDHGEHMSVYDFSSVLWHKSARSDSEGDNCVEVAGLPAVVAVRDSKDPDGPSLTFGRAAFGVLAREIRAGRHDL